MPKLSRKERKCDKTFKTRKDPSNPNTILPDLVPNDILVIGDVIVTDNHPLPLILGIRNNQDYFVLICKDTVDGETGYYIYAPGRCLLTQPHTFQDSDTNVDSFFIHFTFKIKKSVKEFVLPLPKEISKEISKEKVTFPSGAARIICKGFDL